MVFSLRIDLESQKGIKEGVPKLLNLLRNHQIKASFYLAMGGESNIFELIKHRKKLPGERGIKVFSNLEKIRMILFTKNFVKENKQILRQILKEGHELGIHGWKHRKWTRSLEKIDISKEIKKAKEEYLRLFRKEPASFCAPAFRTNKKVIEELNKQKFKIISDLEGDKPKKILYTDIINVPITIKGKNNTPIIEYLITQKYPDDKILDYLKKEIRNKNYSIMYIHGMYEGIQKIDLLDKLFSWIKKENIKVKTIEEIGNENFANNK